MGWKPVRIFVVDEVSFLKVKDMTELNKKLQNLREDTSKPFGGVSIIFSGDFHQLQPVMGTNSDILYSSSPNALWWRNTINAAVFLQSNHRFKEDKPYGDFLDRMRRGETTEEDIEEFINSRVVDGDSVCVPEHPELCYATATNKMRNAITAATFKAHIEATHPLVHSDDPPTFREEQSKHFSHHT